METIEFIAIVVVAAVLIGVVATVASSLASNYRTDGNGAVNKIGTELQTLNGL